MGSRVLSVGVLGTSTLLSNYYFGVQPSGWLLNVFDPVPRVSAAGVVRSVTACPVQALSTPYATTPGTGPMYDSRGGAGRIAQAQVGMLLDLIG